MAKEFTLRSTYLGHTLLLLAMVGTLFAVDRFADRDARAASAAAKEGVTELFRIDLGRDIARQLPPCTEMGRDFWTLHLMRLKEAAESSGLILQGITAARDGDPQPYTGLAGEGQIVPIKLLIRARNAGGETETSASHFQVLMIQGDDGEWLLDGLVPDLPYPSRGGGAL